ncbi:MAG TPA: hypothetical protein VF168_04955 [Trueperaceae bacterium]
MTRQSTCLRTESFRRRPGAARGVDVATQAGESGYADELMLVSAYSPMLPSGL